MGQIVSIAAKPKRCNLQSLSSFGTPAAGEHILVSTDNSMMENGQGNFDAYVVGDGTKAADELELKDITDLKGYNLTRHISVSKNLLNPADVLHEIYLTTTGIDSTSTTDYSSTPLIPVKPNKTYTIFCKKTDVRRLIYFKVDQRYLDRVDHSSKVITIPSNCYWIRFASEKETISTGETVAEAYAGWGVIEGSNADFQPYAPPENYTSYDIEDGIGNKHDDELVVKRDLLNIGSLNLDGKRLRVKIENGIISISDGTHVLKNSLNENGLFNFNSLVGYFPAETTFNDDIAPIRMMNTTIGANHGMPMYKATISSHGLTNTAIGTAWTQGSYTFYIMQILDENNILFLSQNIGNSETNQQRYPLSAGNVVNSTLGTKAVSAVEVYQVRPWTNNVLHTFRADDKIIDITADGDYYCNKFEVSESYEIKNTENVLQNTISRAGTSAEQSWTGTSIFRVSNIYTFDGSLTCTITSNYTPVAAIKFSDIIGMQSQSRYISIINDVGIYVPNTLPISVGGSTINLNTPYTLNASNSDAWHFNSATYKDAQNPPNRFVRLWDDYNFEFATGWLPYDNAPSGAYTEEMFYKETNNKFYFQPVQSAIVGSTIQVGTLYSVVGYRAWFDIPADTNKVAQYSVRYGGYTYIFVDYKASKTMDFVSIDDNRGIEGSSIEVAQAVNTELKSQRYNAGFYVNASYTSGEPCFLVVKVKNV